ncbi:hypothetical protein [Streptomyces sp. NPDC057910]|uniref:hypothetical protein n=1 Tax=Streptomyces sp. NPDC057910 TaxID=3346278 RepID=UPI0036EA115E
MLPPHMGCCGYPEPRTLPSRYHAALARMHLEAPERHAIRSRRCRHEPWLADVELPHGAYRFEASAVQPTPVVPAPRAASDAPSPA